MIVSQFAQFAPPEFWVAPRVGCGKNAEQLCINVDNHGTTGGKEAVAAKRQYCDEPNLAGPSAGIPGRLVGGSCRTHDLTTPQALSHPAACRFHPALGWFCERRSATPEQLANGSLLKTESAMTNNCEDYASENPQRV
jgi:hypothetical protein